jgi:hypothetical protein
MKKNKKIRINLMLVLLTILFLTTSLTVSAQTTETKTENINKQTTGKICGYITWGREHPDYVNKGDIISGENVAVQVIKYGIVRWSESDRSDENGYYEIENIPMGETYKNGEPWEFVVQLSIVINDGGIIYRYRGSSNRFEMPENGDKIIYKNVSTNSVDIERYGLHRNNLFQQIIDFFKINLPIFLDHSFINENFLANKFL